MTFSLPAQRHAAYIALLVGALACSGNGDAKDPSKSGGKRDTEMEHKTCNVESKSAIVHDANGDGRPELIQVMDGKHEECRAVDLNMDGIIDVFVYFDAQGRQERRESGFDRDNRPDEISYFQAGAIVKKERETNNDNNVDTWDYYQGGRLVREERDSNGDGYVDQWWTFSQPARPECAVVVSDNDGDGKPDADSRIDLCKEMAPPPAPEPPKAEPKPTEPTEGEGGASAAPETSAKAGPKDTRPPAPPASQKPPTPPAPQKPPAPAAPQKPAPSAAPKPPTKP